MPPLPLQMGKGTPLRPEFVAIISSVKEISSAPKATGKKHLVTEQYLLADWTQGWKVKLQTKITSIVLSGIAVIGLIMAGVLLWDGEENLRIRFQHFADNVAYRMTQYIHLPNIHNIKAFEPDILKLIHERHFASIDIRHGNQVVTFGRWRREHETLVRTLSIANPSGQNQTVSITLGYTQTHALFKAKQHGFLWGLVAICLLFSVFLSWILNRIVSQPFHSIVDAIRKASDGDLDFRINTARQDEFGELALFFNRMLDKVGEQQEQIQHSLEELSHTRDEAVRANNSKSVFLANMSHEIRTPMNAILGYAQLLQRNPLLNEQVKESVNIIRKSGDHLLMLINDILDLSKIEAGRMVLTTSIFPLSTVVTDLSALFKIRCQQQRLFWSADVGGLSERRFVQGDEGKLKQVLINLLGNAVKFTPTGGVALSLMDLGNDQYRFEVADSGEGISSDAHDTIFDSFTQSQQGLEKGGTGLGLAISARHVEMMGGCLEVDSECGQGARFFFTLHLPQADEQQRPKNQEKTITSLAPDCHIKALVVDDNQLNRDLLSTLLQMIGVSIIEAVNGVDAIEKMAQHRPDIIFMDWRMPVMDGLEATKQIGDQYGTETHIVMISASTLSHEYQMLCDSGAAMVIRKPFTHTEIFNCLATLLDAQFVYAAKPPDQSEITGDLPQDELEIADALQRIQGAAILVVDDNQLNQNVAKGLLKQVGLVVTVANNGEEAVERISLEAFDLVLMDVEMPEMDGLEATEILRRHYPSDGLPIVAMTAQTGDDEHDHCLQVGMNDFVRKPIDAEQLYRVVIRWVKTQVKTRQTEIAIAKGKLDLVAALQRINDDQDLLTYLLSGFRDQYAHTAAELQAHFAADRIDLIQQMAHTIKGLAGNIGAEQLAIVATALDAATKQGDQDGIVPILQDFTETLEAVMVSIHNALDTHKIDIMSN